MMFESQFAVVKMVSNTFVIPPKMLLKFLANHGLAALFFKKMANRAVSLGCMPMLLALQSKWASNRKSTPSGSSRKIKTNMICQKET
jgi:hypothetical protein